MATSDLEPALSKQHFTALPSREESRTIAQKHFEEYVGQPIEDKPFVAEDTQKERDRLWGCWTQHCDDIEVDNRRVWLDFVLRPEDSNAQAPFRSFLRTYVELSVQKRLVLDDREYEYRRTLNSAFSVTEVWRRLVASADHEVMKRQRRDDPAQADIWRLRWISKDEGSREGPAYLLVKWIFTELAVDIGLDTNPTYQKIAMTSTDVGVKLQTLWSRANDIPCNPETRVSFHAIILLAAIGGFRPGTLLHLTYSQFHVAVVRDPTNSARTQIVVTVNIKRNKIKETAKTSRARNGGSIGFSITLIPNCTFCLASLILTRGIQTNSFDPSFTTVDQIFDRPNLEHVDFIPLRWKTDMLEESIFSLSYKTLNELWHRMLLVSGAREDARLYSLRVGTGANLDGVLSDALRNYVLSHTTHVFESSYQSFRVRADLMQLAFKADAGDHSQLFARLCDVSLGRDANAPVNISPEEELEFEERKDVIGLRNTIRTTTDSKERTRLRTNLKNLLKTLCQLKLQDNWIQYFKQVDHLRAQGYTTNNISLPNGNKIPLPPVIGNISQLFHVPVEKQVADYAGHSRRYMSSLLAYLTNTPVVSNELEVKEEDNACSDTSPVSQDGLCRCLLCKKPFANRSALTRHSNALHTDEATFSRPFSCPECQSVGLEETLISSARQWSNHVERVHGKAHAPNWSPEQNPSAQLCCLCPSELATEAGLFSHLNRHVRNGSFRWPITCRICLDIFFDNAWAWLRHLKAYHLPSAQICPLCGHVCSTSSRLTRHFTSNHTQDFQCSFQCPICEQDGAGAIHIIDGFSSWHIHLMSIHSEWADLSWSNSNQYLLTCPEKDSREYTISNRPLTNQIQNHMTSNQYCIYEDEQQQCSSTKSSVPGSPFSCPGLTTATSESTDSPMTETLHGLNNNSFEQSLQLDHGQSKGSQSLTESLHTCHMVSGGTPVPIELVDPALRDDQDLTHPIEDVRGSATDPSFDFQQPDSMDVDKHHAVDCILERWNKNLFLLRWLEDGSYWWVQRKDIDADLVRSFEENYTGISLGVDKVLATRKRHRKVEYRIRWVGRPEDEDTWVAEKHMSPKLVEKHKPKKAASRRRRRY
ncbi:hypothetical protein GGR55DRAFT_304735 [Xylaria sp. FL0064]|nr:hypothetical protein GGR55DRAFT_304735 [Xylaria sp. FL0064]